MSEPTTTEQEAEKRREQQRERVRAYKRFFTTADGLIVLRDLETQFQWGNDPFTNGITHSDLSYRCGTHSPLRYIHKMIEIPLDPIGSQPKKRKAKSGAQPTT